VSIVLGRDDLAVDLLLLSDAKDEGQLVAPCVHLNTSSCRALGSGSEVQRTARTNTLSPFTTVSLDIESLSEVCGVTSVSAKR
jgi:hypothetical protein